MKYFGIKAPIVELEEPYIYWISLSAYQSWSLFFQYPSLGDTVNYNRHPMSTAIKAYEAIGYSCIEVNISET